MLSPTELAQGPTANKLNPARLKAIGTTACIVSSLFSSTTLHAADFTVSNGQTVTTSQQTVGNNATGTVEAGGTISTTATGVPGAGMYSTGDNNTLTNNGTITTTGGSASGMRASGTTTTVTNTGTITTNGNSTRAIYFFGDNGTVINSGTINSTGNNNSIGIRIEDDNNTVTNSGLINKTGTTGSGILIQAVAQFINLVNSGTIRTTGGTAHGIQIDGDDTDVTISGTIETSGANSDGVYITNTAANPDVNVSGNIEISGNGAAGIRTASTNGTITVSGSIIATGSATQAIVATTDQTLKIMSGATIIGSIELAAGNNSVILETDGNATTSATYTINNAGTITTNGDGLTVSKDGTVAIVDSTGFALNQAHLATTTSSINAAINQQLARNASPPEIIVATNSFEGLYLDTNERPFAWGHVIGEYKDRGDNGATMAYRTRTFGFVGGYEKIIGVDRAGIFGGTTISKAKTKTASIESDSNGLFAGGYGEMVNGPWSLRGSVTLGYEMYEKDRLVLDNLNGYETASSDYGSYYISPSVTIVRDYQLAPGNVLSPSATASYALGYVEGHRETGSSSSNLDVGDQVLGASQFRLQLENSHTLGMDDGQIALRGGMTFNHYDASTLDIGLTGAPTVGYNDTKSDNSILGGFVGANLRYDIEDNLTVVADTEIGFAEYEEKSVTGYLGLEYRF